MKSDDNISLKNYVDLRFDATQLAIDKAEATMNTRLESMNLFRDTLKDQAATFITRAEHDTLNSRLDAEIKVLNTAKDMASGKASATSMWVATVMAAAGLILGILGLFVKLKG